MSPKAPQSQTDKGHPLHFAGIHLSGPNAPKSALVILTGGDQQHPLKIGKVYEKIGSFGRLFSDERLVSIVKQQGPFREVFVDCPLSVPPCVDCQRPVCPGAVRCDDLGVAYMLALGEKMQKRRRVRPVNPQSQRLWDIYQENLRSEQGKERMEASYSSNMAPLVIRARTLQRRFAEFAPDLILKETSVMAALEKVAPVLGLSRDVSSDYRHFDRGPACRSAILAAMVAAGWLMEPSDEDADVICQSPEPFQAFVTGWVAALYSSRLTAHPPPDYWQAGGWVHLPDLASHSPAEQPTW